LISFITDFLLKSIKINPKFAMSKNKPIKKLNRQIDESIRNVLNYPKKMDVLLKKSPIRFGAYFPILQAISENTTLSIIKEIAMLREEIEVFIKKTVILKM
jgi:hypothetical protein